MGSMVLGTELQQLGSRLSGKTLEVARRSRRKELMRNLRIIHCTGHIEVASSADSNRINI